MLKQFFKYITQSVAWHDGISVYILADTFFISVQSGCRWTGGAELDPACLRLVYAIGAMIGIGSATRYAISKAQGGNPDFYFTQSIFGA